MRGSGTHSRGGVAVRQQGVRAHPKHLGHSSPGPAHQRSEQRPLGSLPRLVGVTLFTWVLPARSLSVGYFEDWCGSGLSDHVPIVVDIKLQP